MSRQGVPLPEPTFMLWVDDEYEYGFGYSDALCCRAWVEMYGFTIWHQTYFEFGPSDALSARAKAMTDFARTIGEALGARAAL